MDEEESLVCHLPNNPETTKSEDSKGYQANEALGISNNPTERAERTHRTQYCVYPKRPVILTP